MTKQIQLTNLQLNRIIWTLLFLMPIIGMAVDLVTPSLPSISLELHVSQAFVKSVVSIYLLGYAVGTLATGFLTDAYGRRKLLRLNIIIFILSSIMPVLFPNVDVLLTIRLFQGLTIGAIATISRAIFSDVLSPEKLVKLIIVIGSMFGLGPIIGPFLGGYLQFYFGWKACYVFFSLSMLIMCVNVFLWIPETHFNRHKLNFNIIKNNIKL